MNTQQKITTIALMIWLVWFTYWLVCQDNAKASEEYLSLAQEKARLELEKEEESDWWWVDEYAKNECIKSWEDHQNQRQKNNEKRTQRIEEIKKQMGLLESSQAQKKINLTESWSIMNDTAEKTTDSWWFKRLLMWVGWN
jgi:hypothetical protein